MKKLLFLSIATLISFSPFAANAQGFEDVEIDQIQIEQQQEGIELTEEELGGLLSTACNNSSRSKKTVSRKIDSEISTSLSRERLEELTETAIEIKELPTEEQAALCQN